MSAIQGRNLQVVLITSCKDALALGAQCQTHCPLGPPLHAVLYVPTPIYKQRACGTIVSAAALVMLVGLWAQHQPSLLQNRALRFEVSTVLLGRGRARSKMAPVLQLALL